MIEDDEVLTAGTKGTPANKNYLALGVTYSHDDLVHAVREYLTAPAHKAVQRKRVADTFLADIVGQSSHLVCASLLARARPLQGAGRP